ncbi:basic proline-rich protein-like [Tachyglossus aculeatus]|uniref:basic proline-rich protein-like n=1 Tax=Tachyglossus aculeatus TaxID=9261 RepID=UPI0018F7A1C9|nr:basic proline-rich protein-like [Tachyglossus aculeatus]
MPRRCFSLGGCGPGLRRRTQVLIPAPPRACRVNSGQPFRFRRPRPRPPRLALTGARGWRWMRPWGQGVSRVGLGGFRGAVAEVTMAVTVVMESVWARRLPGPGPAGGKGTEGRWRKTDPAAASLPSFSGLVRRETGSPPLGHAPIRPYACSGPRPTLLRMRRLPLLPSHRPSRRMLRTPPLSPPHDVTDSLPPLRMLRTQPLSPPHNVTRSVPPPPLRMLSTPHSSPLTLPASRPTPVRMLSPATPGGCQWDLHPLLRMLQKPRPPHLPSLVRMRYPSALTPFPTCGSGPRPRFYACSGHRPLPAHRLCACAPPRYPLSSDVRAKCGPGPRFYACSGHRPLRALRLCACAVPHGAPPPPPPDVRLKKWDPPLPLRMIRSPRPSSRRLCACAILRAPLSPDVWAKSGPGPRFYACFGHRPPPPRPSLLLRMLRPPPPPGPSLLRMRRPSRPPPDVGLKSGPGPRFYACSGHQRGGPPPLPSPARMRALPSRAVQEWTCRPSLMRMRHPWRPLLTCGRVGPVPASAHAPFAAPLPGPSLVRMRCPSPTVDRTGPNRIGPDRTGPDREDERLTPDRLLRPSPARTGPNRSDPVLPLRDKPGRTEEEPEQGHSSRCPRGHVTAVPTYSPTGPARPAGHIPVAPTGSVVTSFRGGRMFPAAATGLIVGEGAGRPPSRPAPATGSLPSVPAAHRPPTHSRVPSERGLAGRRHILQPGQLHPSGDETPTQPPRAGTGVRDPSSTVAPGGAGTPAP